METGSIIIQIINSAKSATLLEWVTAIGTVGIGIIALFNERIQKYFNRPKIEIRFGDQSPFVEYSSDRKTKYIKLKVINNGKTLAKNCYLKLIRVYSLLNSMDDVSDPVTLKWSNSPVDSRYLIQNEDNLGSAQSLIPSYKEKKDIPPNSAWELCDLLRSDKDGDVVEFLSNLNEYRYIERISDYFIWIYIYGDNFKPIEISLKLMANQKREVRIKSRNKKRFFKR